MGRRCRGRVLPWTLSGDSQKRDTEVEDSLDGAWLALDAPVRRSHEHCEGCERKVRRALEGMKGVRDVTIEANAQKVTVVGYVEPNRVVARIIHRTGKRAELYPFVPYDVVSHPYASGVYDNRAPVGYVRNTEYDPHVSRLARASSTEVRYTTAFSDENASACVIM
ncbi:Heavy metal transport/detoxification superfamily protein [Raphanus sativus]|nr:Heavy metal transport/detoxification superfamily protein [Raphanus sativus]